jgi:glycosyltransferase involved in cell wall biosynthesis
MKISFLLPTRDRLEYLRQAVETIRRQRYEGWEIVISDNASTDDVGGFVTDLSDERIRYFRTERVVPVTENWNNALALSTGDYVLMLGDDDGLLPDYCTRIAAIVSEFGAPDIVYSRALLLTYPGVLADAVAGSLRIMGCARFFDRAVRPFELETTLARALVRESAKLRLRFDFNMQLFTISRNTIERLCHDGRFFHSPFPDYYAANLLFLRSRRIVVEPRPLAVIGITPKSYGFFHFNRREEEGMDLLRNYDPSEASASRAERFLLPGNRMNTCWLLAIEALRRLEPKATIMPVAYRRYRLLQVIDAARRRFLEGSMRSEDFAQIIDHLRLWEKVIYGAAGAAVFLATRPLPSGGRHRVLQEIERALNQYPESTSSALEGEYETVLDVFNASARGELRSARCDSARVR